MHVWVTFLLGDEHAIRVALSLCYAPQCHHRDFSLWGIQAQTIHFTNKSGLGSWQLHGENHRCHCFCLMTDAHLPEYVRSCGCGTGSDHCHLLPWEDQGPLRVWTAAVASCPGCPRSQHGSNPTLWPRGGNGSHAKMVRLCIRGKGVFWNVYITSPKQITWPPLSAVQERQDCLLPVTVEAEGFPRASFVFLSPHIGEGITKFIEWLSPWKMQRGLSSFQLLAKWTLSLYVIAKPKDKLISLLAG